MKRLLVLATLLALAALPGTATAQLAEDYRFRGAVVDSQGKPVAGARLQLRDTEVGRRIEFKSDKEGKFDRRMVPNAVYDLTVDKEGYVTQTMRYDWSASTPSTVVKEAQIVLQSVGEKEQIEGERAKVELGKKTGKLYQEAYAALNAGDCATARQKAEEVLAIGAGSFEYAVRFVVARCLASGGDNAGGEAAYRKVIELKPDLFEAQYDLAGVLELQGKHDEAIAVYGRAAELKPGDVDTHYNTGAILFRLGRFDEAKPHLRRAIELNPAHAHAVKALGFSQLSAKEKNMAEAATLLARYLDLSPGAADGEQVRQILKELERAKPGK